jgi:hypothetical protein
MLKSKFTLFNKIFLIHIVILVFFLTNAQGSELSSRFLNVVVDDALYSPFNLLADKFIKKSNTILNVKYVNNSFYKNLSYDEKINVFITQKSNKNFIEKFFNVKASNFIGIATYCLCVNQDSDLKNANILSLSDLEKNNFVQNIGVGGTNSAFFLSKKPKLSKKIEEYSDALLAIQDLYLKKYDVGFFLYPMCNSKKGMIPIYIIDAVDMKNKNDFIVDYRIFVVNSLNESAQNFISFFSNISEINDLLKDYGIMGKSRQFSQN